MLKELSQEYLGDFHAWVHQQMTAAIKEEPSYEPRPTYSTLDPAARLQTLAWNSQMGMIHASPTNCPSGQPYRWFRVPTLEQSGTRVHDDGSARWAWGCPATPPGPITTHLHGFNVQVMDGQKVLCSRNRARPMDPAPCVPVDRLRSITPAQAVALQQLSERERAFEQDLEAHRQFIP